MYKLKLIIDSKMEDVTEFLEFKLVVVDENSIVKSVVSRCTAESNIYRTRDLDKLVELIELSVNGLLNQVKEEVLPSPKLHPESML